MRNENQRQLRTLLPLLVTFIPHRFSLPTFIPHSRIRAFRIAFRTLFRVRDRLLLLFLALVIVTFAIGGGSALTRPIALHAAMLIGYLIVLAATRSKGAIATAVRSLALLAIVFTMYQSIAEPAFVAMHGARDASLASIDRILFFGHDPALVGERHLTPARLEFFSFIYGWFIPYLYLSIFFGCLGRPAAEREGFLDGLTITYVIAYLGYLFLPSRGPVEYYHFAAPLHGGWFHQMVLASVTATGGNHGAFPSLHVGASAYLCLFDLRHHRLRGMTYLPMVLLIAISTVFLRYHYVIDIVVGITIAVVADQVASRRSDLQRKLVPASVPAAPNHGEPARSASRYTAEVGR